MARLIPRNDRVDYKRVDLLEAAIREAAHRYSFTIALLKVRADGYNPPVIELTLVQEPGEVQE